MKRFLALIVLCMAQQRVYDCFKLPSLIEPKSLGLDTLSEDESHWLFFFLTWGTFQEGEKCGLN